jgi:imidazoleglycerol-phosphate dehydratase
MEASKLGITLNGSTPHEVSLARMTLESCVEVHIEDGKRRPYNIQTGRKFFNGMLACIGSRAHLNLDVSFSPIEAVMLEHVIAEDVGLAFGRAIRELLEARRPEGSNERGFYTVAFDEALVSVTLAFDGRAYTFLRGEVPATKLEHVEDILATSLKQFFEGFAQGAGCVVQIQFFAGEDSHHTWEATFKAFGEALRDSLEPCPYRAGTTIGLKGTGMERKT